MEAQAAERYLLGELSAADAESFERHYFECTECAMAVEAGEQFIANARAVMAKPDTGLLHPLPRDKAGRSTRRSFRDVWAGWMQPGFGLPSFVLPSLAAVLFAAVALYQGAVLIPGLRHTVDSARALPAFELVGASRGEAAQVTVPRTAPFFALSFDVPPDLKFDSYVCDLSLGGQTAFHVISPAPAAGRPISILVPVTGLKPGSYTLTVAGVGTQGAPADQVVASPFELQFNQ